MSHAIAERIRTAENLPTPPSVAVEVLRLTKDDGVSTAELGAVIQNDPALTARILKLINSSMFGMPRRVTSVSQAMSLLGWRTVRVIALSFSLVDMLKEDKATAFDYEGYWRLSLTTAVAGRLLAKAAGSRLGEEAFIAGLLSEIARLAAARCAPELYGPVTEEQAATGRPSHEVELRQLGVTHGALGKSLLTQWGLPSALCAAVGAHHGEGFHALRDDEAELARLVRSAAAVAGLFCGDSPDALLDGVKEECRRAIGVSDEGLERALTDLAEHVRTAAALMSVQIGEVQDYTAVQIEAARRLSKLSMQAESDLLAATMRERDARQEAERLRQERHEMLRIATTDALTNIPNRAAFDTRLAAELELARTSGELIAVLMMDIDHFKDINDEHGHPAGNAVLRAVAETARTASAPGFVARYGGEEFTIILTRDGANQAEAVAEKIRREVEARVVQRAGGALRVTASVGAAVASGAEPGLDAEQLLERADRRLYQAKRNGRNRVEVERAGRAGRPGGSPASNRAA